jgi:hypothetical protein
MQAVVCGEALPRCAKLVLDDRAPYAGENGEEEDRVADFREVFEKDGRKFGEQVGNGSSSDVFTRMVATRTAGAPRINMMPRYTYMYLWVGEERSSKGERG